MASINDVFNQLTAVNSNLGLIHADGLAQVNATDQVRNSVNTLDNDLKAGFSATIHALSVIAQIESETAKLLFHLTQQADAMICALEHISQNTCGILTQVTMQTALQKRLVENSDVMRSIEEFAHPDAALEQQRLAALNRKVEQCCPPPVVPPACSYEPCPHPRPVPMPDLPRIDTQPRRPGSTQPPG